jgi:hypothetical protein
MKFFVSGKFEEKERVRAIYRAVQAHGHQISCDWTHHVPIKPCAAHADLARLYCSNELKGIRQADVFIYLSHQQGTTLPMEFGAALLRNVREGSPKIFVVGDQNTR